MDVFALELIRNLQLIDHENEYLIFVKPGADASVLQETENFKIVQLKSRFYPFWEQVSLLRASRKAGCQILHCTANTAPILNKIPLVFQLHDIIYLESSCLKILTRSGTLYQKFGNIYRRMIVPLIVKKSRRIVTVSNLEKNRISSFFGIGESSHLKAIYCGVSEHFKPVTNIQELNRVKERYNLPDYYFFFLGNTDPKKNTKGTIKAYSEFVKKRGNGIKLVVADYERQELVSLLSEISDPLLINNIVLAGYVSNNDLPAIYSRCEIFLYPSIRESFGIPVLEAMACGVPVISSNMASMNEVAGDAALLPDPHQPDEITAAMIRIVDDTELKSGLITKGFIRAAGFSWKSMAEKMLAVYLEVGDEEGLTAKRGFNGINTINSN
jgi:glycosyltransferase involved in cell wall biosynthesis